MSDLQVRGPLYGGTGSPAPFTAGISGAQRVLDGHARYFDAASRGKTFIGANLAGTPVTTQAGLSATTPALTLYNPANSGIFAVLQTVMVNLAAAPAAACHFMLAINAPTAAAPTSVTTATVQSARTDSLAMPTCSVYRVATLAATPVAIRYFGHILAAAGITPPQLLDRIEGEIIVGPGVALSLQTSSAASVVAAFTWEEIPLLP